MSLFAVKLILTPILILGTTLAARRWGPVVGGFLVGLPLTSGPVSFFLAVEQGREFAVRAAASTLLGTLAVGGFCVAYAHASRRLSWPLATLFSLAAYFVCVSCFSGLSLPWYLGLPLVFAALTLGALSVHPGFDAPPPNAPPPWDLPFRLVSATAVVATVTALSSGLGSSWSGLLSTIPVVICVMSAFTHALYGQSAAQRFERGVIIGCFSFAAFFAVVCLLLPWAGLAVVYLGASLAACLLNLLSYRLFGRTRPSVAAPGK